MYRALRGERIGLADVLSSNSLQRIFRYLNNQVSRSQKIEMPLYNLISIYHMFPAPYARTEKGIEWLVQNHIKFIALFLIHESKEKMLSAKLRSQGHNASLQLSHTAFICLGCYNNTSDSGLQKRILFSHSYETWKFKIKAPELTLFLFPVLQLGIFLCVLHQLFSYKLTEWEQAPGSFPFCIWGQDRGLGFYFMASFILHNVPMGKSHHGPVKALVGNHWFCQGTF